MKVLGVCFLLSLLVLGAVQQSNAQTPCTDTLTDTLAATPELSSLNTVVQAAGLAETFDDPSLNVTVFAPNNAAIAAFVQLLNASGLTLANVTGPSSNRAATIILYHVLTSPNTAAQLVDDQTYPTLLSGSTLTVDRNATTVEIEAAESNAIVVTPDIAVCNSYVHIINDVLLPAELGDIEPYTAPPPPPPGTPPAPPGTVTPPTSDATAAVGSSMLIAAVSAAIAAVFATL